ncbi:MAG: response regulator [Lysinibacillus sp.]
MKKILIVDDQQGIRALLNEIFQREGFETVQCGNGLQAVQLVQEQQFDLMLLDMNLPGLHGIEVLKEVRNDLQQKVPIMMMTAYGEQDLIEEALSYQDVQYFTKPFNIFELLTQVKNILAE